MKAAQIKVTFVLLLIVQLLDSVLHNNPCHLLQGLILVGCYTAYIGGCLPVFRDRLVASTVDWLLKQVLSLFA